MISFVLLNWNSRGFLRRCVESLVQQNDPRWELIIVDNGSSNESRAWIDEWEASRVATTVLRFETNTGFAAGMNAGIRLARGDMVVPLNTDVFLARNFVQAVHNHYSEAPSNLGCIATPVYVWRWDDSQDVLTDQLYTVGVTVVRRLSVSAWHPDFESTDQLFGADGSAPVITRAAVSHCERLQGGLYDERYGSFGEDIDLFARLRLADFGFEVVFDTAYWHIGSGSVGGVLSYNRKPVELQVQAQRNRLYNFQKLPGRIKWVSLLPWVALDDLFRLVAVRHRATLFAHFMRNYGRIRRQDGAAYNRGRLRFAGNAFSASAIHRWRNGALPPLRENLAILREHVSHNK